MTLVHPDDRERPSSRAFNPTCSARPGSSRSSIGPGTRTGRSAGCSHAAWPCATRRAGRFASSAAASTSPPTRAEEALRESEERFRGTFENAAVGIAHKDADGRWLRVNEKYCEIVGYTRDELLQRTFQGHHAPRRSGGRARAVHPADARRSAQLLAGEALYPQGRLARSGSICRCRSSATRRAGPPMPSRSSRTSRSASGWRRRRARPRRRRRRPTGPRTSSWPTSATRSARP